jgi:hypothetical protein
VHTGTNDTVVVTAHEILVFKLTIPKLSRAFTISRGRNGNFLNDIDIFLNALIKDLIENYLILHFRGFGCSFCYVISTRSRGARKSSLRTLTKPSLFRFIRFVSLFNFCCYHCLYFYVPSFSEEGLSARKFNFLCFFFYCFRRLNVFCVRSFVGDFHRIAFVKLTCFAFTKGQVIFLDFLGHLDATWDGWLV